MTPYSIIALGSIAVASVVALAFYLAWNRQTAFCNLFAAVVGATIGTAALTGQPPSPGGIIAFIIGMIAFGVTVGLYFQALMAAIHRQVSGSDAEQASAAFE